MNNPAKRLHTIITGLKKLPESRVDEAFAKVLNVESKNYSLLLKRIGMVFMLIDAIKRAVKSIEGIDHKKYLLSASDISAKIRGVGFATRIKHSTIAQISDGTMIHLDMTAEYLSERTPEPTITEENRKKILDSIFDFWKEVENISGVPEQLKVYIFDKLDLLRQAVEVYDICGANPVKDACEGAVGGMIFQYRQYEQQDTAKQLLGKLVKCAIAAYCLIKFANNIASLPESLKTIAGFLGIGD